MTTLAMGGSRTTGALPPTPSASPRDDGDPGVERRQGIADTDAASAEDSTPPLPKALMGAPRVAWTDQGSLLVQPLEAVDQASVIVSASGRSVAEPPNACDVPLEPCLHQHSPESTYVSLCTAQERETLATNAGQVLSPFYQARDYQRKLLMSEVPLFVQCLPSTDAQALVVYAGAACGRHIVVLLDLFPNLSFDLYDPAPNGWDEALLAIADTEPNGGTDDGNTNDSGRHHRSRVRINPPPSRDGWFTDEVARSYAPCGVNAQVRGLDNNKL